MGEGGERSLSGSYVTFDPSQGGDPYYTPGETSNLIFRAECFTGDWEYAYEIWLKFPAGWVVNSASVFGTPTCDNGGGIGGFSYVVPSSNILEINDPRYMGYTDHCVTYYMVNVTAGPSTGTAAVSWYWSGDGYNNPPHHPCSSDGYTPDGWPACDEMTNPQAFIPENNYLSCPGLSIFSQPPVNSNNAYFSDESTDWGDQRMFENFSGLTDMIGGISFWGLFYNGSDCYTGGSDNFVITFYTDEAGVVGTAVNSFTLTLTPIVTDLVNSGCYVLRYDAMLPVNVGLANGWVKIYRQNPTNSVCAFAWARTDSGDGVSGFSQFGGTVFYQADNLAFCLSPANAIVPVSSWAIFIGIGLILLIAVVRFRRMI